MTPYYKNAVRRLDSAIQLNDICAYAAAMLLCAVKHGAVDKEVIAKTGVPLPAGRAIAWRLRRSRVWRKTKTHAEWSDPATGVIAFWMDVCVGAGLMKHGYGPKASRPDSLERGGDGGST